MNEEDNFDDLPNITKNIESKINQKQKLNTSKTKEGNIQNIKQISKINCIDNINQIEKNLIEDNTKLKDALAKKNKEISKNLDNFIKKLEKDTNDHIKKIETSNLSENEKQAEYIKCIDQLDNILSLSESLKKCIIKSEDNLINFLQQHDISLDKELILSFINNKENDLNDTNVYNYLDDKQEYSEKVFNNMKPSDIRNYIIKSNEENKNIALKKLKINNYSDFSKIKEILLNTNKKDIFLQNQIEKISISNLTRNQFIYIFNKDFKIKKKDVVNLNDIINIKSDKNLIFDLGKRSSTIVINDTDKEKIYNKLSNKEIIKRTESEFIIIENDKDDMSKYYIDIDFYYPNIYIKNCNLKDVNLNEIFSKVEILKLSSCQLSFDFYDIIKKDSFSQVSELYLENCNIVNENFNEIIFAIIKNEKLRLNLKYFSLKNNKLSCINIYKYILDGNISRNKFESLEVLDLSNNNINILDNKSLSGLPNLSIINLANNNFQFPDDFSTLYQKNKKKMKKIKTMMEEASKVNKTDEKTPIPTSTSSNSLIQTETEAPTSAPAPALTPTPTFKTSSTNLSQIDDIFLFIISGNAALLKGDNMNIYLKYLIEILPKLIYPLRSIDLNGLFYRTKYHNLLKSLDLTKFQSSLVEINLSSCNIIDEELANLLLKEYCIINVKNMNLSNNKLTDKLFNYLIDNKSYDIYTKIKNIDLSNNEIKLNGVKDFKYFAELFDSIQTIIINNTEAEENINYYIQKLIKIFNETQNGKGAKTKFNNIDLSIQDLIHNKQGKEYCFINNSHIKLKMKNIIDYRYIDAAQKIYPELFDRIIIEHKYTGPN